MTTIFSISNYLPFCSEIIFVQIGGNKYFIGVVLLLQTNIHSFEIRKSIFQI